MFLGVLFSVSLLSPVHAQDQYPISPILTRDIREISCFDKSTLEYQVKYDFISDDSITKYVNPDIGLQNEQYKPIDLVSLEGYSYIEIRGNEGRLRKEAADSLQALANVFYQEFKKSLIIVSSFRGYEYQKKLLGGYKEKYGGRAATFSAKPGHSEHQLGLAIDLFNASTQGIEGYKDFFSWLRSNAHLYGWTQSYQKGISVDGYVVEPWHWRYVGVELATYLYENKMTLGEYVSFWSIWN